MDTAVADTAVLPYHTAVADTAVLHTPYCCICVCVDSSAVWKSLPRETYRAELWVSVSILLEVCDVFRITHESGG